MYQSKIEKRLGTMQAFQEQAMEHTPIPQTSYENLGAGNHRSAWGTWFEVAKPWSVMNSTFEVSVQPNGEGVLCLLLLANKPHIVIKP